MFWKTIFKKKSGATVTYVLVAVFYLLNIFSIRFIFFPFLICTCQNFQRFRINCYCNKLLQKLKIAFSHLRLKIHKRINYVRLLNKVDSKNSKRIDNLNNSVKNSLKNLKIFFKNSVHFQFGFYVYLILLKLVMQQSSIYF